MVKKLERNFDKKLYIKKFAKGWIESLRSLRLDVANSKIDTNELNSIEQTESEPSESEMNKKNVEYYE
jgi:hypothetical protein